jgi:hypothetical protein
MPRKKKILTPTQLHKQIKMVIKDYTYDEVRSGLENFSPEEWWDVREQLRQKLPQMNFDKLDLYDFKQLTYRMYGVEPEWDVIQTVH